MNAIPLIVGSMLMLMLTVLAKDAAVVSSFFSASFILGFVALSVALKPPPKP